MIPDVSPPAARLTSQFMRFGVVGIVGFVVNTAVVYALRGTTGLYVTGFIAWIAAATLTWILNRSWTFRAPRVSGLHREWARFLGANSIGFLLYYSVYAALVTSCARCATQPVIAVLAGAAVGLVANFTLSRQVVFR